MSYDPRAIANLILDCADQEGIEVTNLSLNKIAYFVHALYLAKFEQPLIDAKIEAWNYGPVIREIYSEFKGFGANPITARAQKFDVEKLRRTVVIEDITEDDLAFVANHARRYMKISAGNLVALSHERGSPWDLVFNESGRVNPGMEISNDIIRDYFKTQVRH